MPNTPVPQLEKPLFEKPWFAGSFAFVLSIPAGMLLVFLFEGVYIAFTSLDSFESFYLGITLLIFAHILLLTVLTFIAPLFALLGMVIAYAVARKHPTNLFRTLLMIGTAIFVVGYTFTAFLSP